MRDVKETLKVSMVGKEFTIERNATDTVTPTEFLNIHKSIQDALDARQKEYDELEPQFKQRKELLEKELVGLKERMKEFESYLGRAKKLSAIEKKEEERKTKEVKG